SVHLADYPETDPAAIDERLDEAMRAIRDLAALGRNIRTEHRIKVRQPLPSAVVHYAGRDEDLEPLLPLLAEELNVKGVQLAESSASLIRWRAKPSFRTLGPRLGSGVKKLAETLSRDDGSLAASLAAGGPAAAIERHRDTIAGETLAVEVLAQAVPDAFHREGAEIEGATLEVTLAKREPS